MDLCPDCCGKIFNATCAVYGCSEYRSSRTKDCGLRLYRPADCSSDLDRYCTVEPYFKESRSEERRVGKELKTEFSALGKKKMKKYRAKLMISQRERLKCIVE